MSRKVQCSSCARKVDRDSEIRCDHTLCRGVMCASCYERDKYCEIGDHSAGDSVSLLHLYRKKKSAAAPANQTNIK